MNYPLRFILIGGFLGAGKTSAVIALASWLKKTRGLTAGIITNDQAPGLVDSQMARMAQFAVREVAGGCFCCKSDSLAEAIRAFTAQRQVDVILGEPVGSCTDLIATVLGPMRSVHGFAHGLSPLSVMVDPFRVSALLSGRSGFSNEVTYIYERQLEEAAMIVVNKCEMLAGERLTLLLENLRQRYPGKQVLPVSVRTGKNLESWWEQLLSREHESLPFMDVDYELYAKGEAKLGWLNGEYEFVITGTQGLEEAIDSNELLARIARGIHNDFVNLRMEIAHLKISMQSHEGEPEQLATIQCTRNGREPEFTQKAASPLRSGRILLNVRAEAPPHLLSDVVSRALGDLHDAITLKEIKCQAFEPLPPKPTHRLQNEPA